MANKKFPKSGLPIRKTVELLPTVFRTDANDKFMSAVVDPLVQPGVLDKTVGYIGRRYGKTYNGNDVYLDTDNTLRSRYQLEPGIVYKKDTKVENFYDYLDFKNQLQFFGNTDHRDDKITSHEHYSWTPPIDWDKFVNYREYYWEPSGPPAIPVYGQAAGIISTYKVSLGIGSTFIFTPDAYTNNPTITLYRGQTYKFNVNAPNEGFAIRTNYDQASIAYNPVLPYSKGQLAIYDGKLWRAKIDMVALDGSTIDIDTQDWELVETVSTSISLDYNSGVTNNGAQTGIVTFQVPYDAPDTLYYQSLIDPNRFGQFIISNIEANTKLNVTTEILRKSQYTSSNGVEFTNGLVVEFRGQVTPANYALDTWLISGVGSEITLTRFSDLTPPALNADNPEVLFDNEGFDTQPFDDATTYPGTKDYITIAKNSADRNPWSRYNRWFHRSVLEYAYTSRGEDFLATESLRAKRPIIEFVANMQLFNHGSVGKESVDYLDDYTTDIFSQIEGSTGYNIDGEFLFEGARILVVNDTDVLANNKIYEVTFITFNGNKQIRLVEPADSNAEVGDGVLIRRGNNNAGSMVYFNGTTWKTSQVKTSVNQQPLFDVFDENEVSLADQDTYPVSTFTGSKILSYKIGSSVVDNELGFSISYLNIGNIGDIVFEWNWDIDTSNYTIDRTIYSKKIAAGYYKINGQGFNNGWSVAEGLHPIIDSTTIVDATSAVTLNTLDWASIDFNDTLINFYHNGKRLTDTYTLDNNTFTFSNTVFAENDIVSIKVIADIAPTDGYYELPTGFEKNPLNEDLTTFTLGQAVDHVATAVEFDRTFVGSIPGSSNLRDLVNYKASAKRFLKHSGIAALSMALLCDKTNNIVKSIQYAKKSYTDFKNNFIIKSTEIDYVDNVADFVDDIILELTKTKTISNPFSDSDMIGSGAYSSIEYAVLDDGIKTFAISKRFSLSEQSRNAVYVYLNNEQLLNGSQYQFNDTFGFITVLADIAVGDSIQIREYTSTSFCHIPQTPTKMGLYKKYTPKKFIDDTYQEPKLVIQGHDGSITIAYGDYRDDLLLELEYRIYNNIKVTYDRSIFDIDDVIGSYYYSPLFSKTQLDEIVSQEFLKWVQNTNINYTLNEYFDSENSFTYTYSNMTDITGTDNLPGWWRGVYQYFYDTDRPHRCPWEMLGFSEQPEWWESEYGAAPYTSGNLLLWEDLAEGVIRQGDRAGIYPRYARPTLLYHIPVNSDGKLLSPLQSGLAGNFTLVNNTGNFVLGDISPAEYAWRSSSEWPFAVVLAMSLMKPFEFISDGFDRSKTTINKLGHTVNKTTNLVSSLADMTIPEAGVDQATGLVNYLSSYLKSRGIDPLAANDWIQNLDVLLSSRLSGFVDKAQQKYLLDSKSPASSTSSIFIPPENYDIIFNVSAPISSVSYSGVILEKTEGGWLVTGYDSIHPYFNYFEAYANQKDPIIAVGGVSESFLDWTEDKTYNNGQLIRFRNDFYRSLKTHTSGNEFDTTLWKKTPGVPTIGGIEAARRRQFNTFKINRLTYGTKLTSIQAVVDFLLGYDAYLKSIGFTFDRYSYDLNAAQDWLTSCKEFMFWSKHNWSIGALLTLSPAAEKVQITMPVGVADNLLDGFYDYQILKSDGKPLTPNYINVNRDFQSLTVNTVNTTDGIYYIKVYFVLKEHVVVFNDRTIFNDVIYDKTTGYRQERIKTQGFRTTDWDGDYTSPGFLFDNIAIQEWQPFVDYKLGDIVSYRSYNWTSLTNQLGAETFVDTFWSKLDTTPEKQLVANFDYKINQFSDYYETSASGIGDSQRTLARHAVGYQTREYLQNLAEDPVTQFQLYTGFIREKGTSSAITKVFNKLSSAGQGGVTLSEEWAFRVGSIGGIDQLTEAEFTLYKDQFVVNPQPISIETSAPALVTDQYYRVLKSDFTIDPILFKTALNPLASSYTSLKTAGYVKSEQVALVLQSRDDILNLGIDDVADNDTIWVTFDQYTWTVLQYNESPSLIVRGVEKDSTLVTVTFNRRTQFAIGDIVGFNNIINLTGFFKITAVGVKTITVEVSATAQTPELDSTTIPTTGIFTVARVDNYESLDASQVALLKTGSKLWIDNNGSDKWEVVEKQKQFALKEFVNSGIAEPLHLGKKVLYSDSLRQTIASIPDLGYVMVYSEVPTGLTIRQILNAPLEVADYVTGSFGSKMALSPDSKWMMVASPSASYVQTNFVGAFDKDASYTANDIVLEHGVLWQAKVNIIADGSTNSTIDLESNDWTPATNVFASSTGNGAGFNNQGVVTIYESVNQNWVSRETFASPLPSTNEFFGSEVSMGKYGSTYYMAVSATGSADGKGRVYLYTNNGTGWELSQNPAYRGLYSSNTPYIAGSIVWYDSKLWQALVDVAGDDSTIGVADATAGDWKQLDPVATQFALPLAVSPSDDGSTLAIDPSQLTELIKEGDAFGTSLAMSSDASILAIGAPNADDQYFANFKGEWRSDVTYTTNDVVRDMGIYYKVIDTRTWADNETDSSAFTTSGLDTRPENGDPWIAVGDSTVKSSGKVFIYKKSVYGIYNLLQTITTSSILEISDIAESFIHTGDQFGFSLDFDSTGSTLVVTSPTADINFQNQGSAYVFTTASTALPSYRLTQKIESFEIYPNEFFGQSVAISAGGERIVVGAKNTQYSVPSKIDVVEGTTYDHGRTTFIDRSGFAGGVYVFEKKTDTYFLVEKLEADLTPYESFGYSVDCTASKIVIGSPDYKEPVLDQATQRTIFPGLPIGTVRMFTKDESTDSLAVIAVEEPLVDIAKVKSIALYDTVNNVKIQDIDYVDHAKLKILNAAEAELAFKTVYDPAVYSIGTENESVDTSASWAEKYVGQLWWDLSTAKWKDYEQADLAYKSANWNGLALGASIEVYEWVQSPLLPSEWAALADTNEGLAEGISGQPMHPNDDVYSVKEYYSNATGLLSGTQYFYWVKNKVTVPAGVVGRTLSASSVASYISNPAGTGSAFIALVGANQYLAYNFETVMSEDTASINIQFVKNSESLTPVHHEYQLLTEGVADSVPTGKLEEKWLDSLVGANASGSAVPDPALPPKQRYGVSFRPRQSMFVDRLAALKTVVSNINAVLLKEPFADTIDFKNLNLTDNAPSSELNLYDVAVDNEVDLIAVGTSRIKQAVLRANIVDGRIDTIDIIDPGYGYRPKELFDQEIPGVYIGPPIVVLGTGTGATARCHIDGQGRVITVVVTSKGKKYSSATATVRPFAVLVNVDSTYNNFWSIYSWDDSRNVFFRSQSQSYNTANYWQLIDWWAAGYSPTSRVVKEVNTINILETIVTDVNDLVRIKEFGNGGWAVYKKISNTATTFSETYALVGREKGTLELLPITYNTTISGIGYDNVQTFDVKSYDLQNSLELRNIFKAVKEDIFIADYAVEWNKLFFTCIRQVFAEQQYVDWAFKTSFLNATHNVGNLYQRLNYKNDNLSSYQDYINEVKPYRTTIREYISKYTSTDIIRSENTDFDLPPVYSATYSSAIPVTEYSDQISQYPWVSWANNHTYEITNIVVANAGSNYTSPPNVLITGTGTGATAQAFISNGKVSGINVLTSGAGYTSAPEIKLVGGNSSNSDIATAVAIIGNTKARTFTVSMKFDRISKEGLYTNFVQNESFVANGYSSTFELKYAPTRDKTKIKIIKNNQLVLNNEYSISLYTLPSDEYSILRGKLIFVEIPTKADVITVEYEKNDLLLDAVSRIQKFYAPSSGMKGDDLGQLMTGIDFGGVQIQGTTFDVTGGWDALPWFTDNWDSVESSADFYYVFDASEYSNTKTYKVNDYVSRLGDVYIAQQASTGVVPDGSSDFWVPTTLESVTLPFVPTNGQEINIYIKRANSSTPVRIDDPAYTNSWDSSSAVNPNAQMPTFIGDGSTAVVDLRGYVYANAGDTLIFRPSDSDGSVTITDDNLLDTKLSGGTLATTGSSYSTANGTLAEDISIDGSGFINPDHVPATEENVPGQVLDSVSIKVFSAIDSGTAPLNTSIYIGNSTTSKYLIGLDIIESKSLIVYIDKIEQIYNTDYTINFETSKIEFTAAPATGTIIELVSLGLGGVALLDYQEFTADGQTSLFLTNADFNETSSVFVTVNGLHIDTGFVNSTDLVDIDNKTLIQFGTTPLINSVIKVVSLASSTTIVPDIVQVNRQTFEFEGSTRSFEIDNFVDISNTASPSSAVVELNYNNTGYRVLRGVDTTYAVYDGTNDTFILGLDPLEPAGTILASNVKVFINNEVQVFVQDYVYNGTSKELTIVADMTVGDIIRIENDFRSEYFISGTTLQLSSNVVLESTDELSNDTIRITWFSEYPSMKIVSDEFTGGKVQYQLGYNPLSVNYVWVYKNGNRLTKDQDYAVSLPRGVVYLTDSSTADDLIKIVSFGNKIYAQPSGYEIHKDMLNTYHYKRYSLTPITLASDLTYYDQTMTVSDASTLATPVRSRNIAGIVVVNGERIEYLQKSGNVLSQLRRGLQGTAIKELHTAGSKVVDVSTPETIPYNENQDRVDIRVEVSTFTYAGSNTFTLDTDVKFGLGSKANLVVSITKKATGVTSIITDYTILASSVGGTITVNSDLLATGDVVKVNSLILGVLEFTPVKSTRTSWDRITIPTDYGPCDHIEVFSGGARLRKDSIKVYSELLGAVSPAADKTIEAEFSVDGSSNYVRLTAPAPAGTRVTIIRKTGKVWYNTGDNTASSGVTLLENTTPIAKFIAKKTSALPE